MIFATVPRSPLENMEMIREICGNYAHTFGPRSGNLLFTGPPGLGKTFLSACIAREVSDLGFSVVYDTGPLVMMSEANHAKALEILKKAGYVG